MSAEWAVRDTATGAVYPQPNRLIAEMVAEAHGWSEVIPLKPEEGQRLVIRVRTGITRGKAAAAAVHAALMHLGVHPGTPVIVLGANVKDIEGMATVVRDAGHTEVEPGTITAGTNGFEQPAHRCSGAVGTHSCTCPTGRDHGPAECQQTPVAEDTWEETHG